MVKKNKKNNSNNTTTTTNRVFLLDIRNDASSYSNSTASLSSSTRVATHNSTTTRTISSSTRNNHIRYLSCETTIHRRIIEMYKCRDEFEVIDLNVRTSQPLSSHTRVDIANALQHMSMKCGKTLRRLSADIDYVDVSVHEFILLQCLTFDEIALTSNPEEQTTLSEGLALSLRHALTSNKKCIRSLQMTSCTFSEETCGILCDALCHAYSLETIHFHLNTSNIQRLQRRFIPGVLEGILGKKKMTTLHLGGAYQPAEYGTQLREVLAHPQCQIQDLSLGYDDESPKLDPTPFFSSFCTSSTTTIKCASLLKLQLHGIHIRDIPMELSLVFPNLQTLRVACSTMPTLSFLELPNELLPHKLVQLEFPGCTTFDIPEGRKLVQRLPNVRQPPFQNDSVVQHYLDWTNCGRAKLHQQPHPGASLWPLILERANRLMKDDGTRRQASIIYSLLVQRQQQTTTKDEELSKKKKESNQELVVYEEEAAPEEMVMAVFGTNEDGDY